MFPGPVKAVLAAKYEVWCRILVVFDDLWKTGSNKLSKVSMESRKEIMPKAKGEG
jgi:hypothetical protein